MLTLPGRRRPGRQVATLLAFAAGATAGGVTTATVAWFFGGLSRPLPEPVRWGLLGVAFLLGLTRDLGFGSISLPQRGWQVPRDAFNRSFVAGAARFGFELGLGFRTYVPSALPYVLLASILLAGFAYPAALALGIGFGLARGLVPVFGIATRDPAWERLSGDRGRLFIRTAWGLVAMVGATAAVGGNVL